jgi:ketosteroid isomerase-like protein
MPIYADPPDDAPGNVAVVVRYYACLNAGDMEGAFAHLAPNIVQEEFPNRLVPNGVVRDLAALREAWARGRTVIATQQFTLTRVFPVGATVIVEADWTGTVARDIGPFKGGAELRARFAQFLEVDGDGRIRAIRNYDCFDPW